MVVSGYFEKVCRTLLCCRVRIPLTCLCPQALENLWIGNEVAAANVLTLRLQFFQCDLFPRCDQNHRREMAVTKILHLVDHPNLRTSLEINDGIERQTVRFHRCCMHARGSFASSIDDLAAISRGIVA